jgi:anti-anti-sigma factor
MTIFSGSAHAPLRVETITNGDTIRILIHGEVDMANVDHLDTGLTAIPLDGIKTVLLDASDLAFVDVAGLRRLMIFAQLMKQTGRAITTCGTTPMLRKMARLLELQDELGLH